MRALELRVPPLLTALVFGAAMAGLARLLPALGFALPFAAALAATIAATGAAVALAGVVAFRRHRTTVHPLTPQAASTLVTSGVYRRSRNPMYLGFLMVLAAWALHLANAAAFVLLPGFVLYMNRFQIEPEERALLAGFGAPFEQYMARVRRWL